MSAHELIESIFKRYQPGMQGHQRRITADQFKYLSDLIGADEEGSALRSGAGGVLVWMPSGRNKYEIRPPALGQKMGTLTKMSNIVASDMGTLF